MFRRSISVACGASAAALLTTAFAVPATAAPPADDQPATSPGDKADDRADALESERRELTRKGTELVLAGDRQVQGRNGSKAVRVAPGQWAQYGLQSTDSILTFLVEFGDQKDPRFPTAPAGPVHNNDPRRPTARRTTARTGPRTSTGSTSWTCSSVTRGVLQESTREMSSGRYTVNGDTPTG